MNGWDTLREHTRPQKQLTLFPKGTMRAPVVGSFISPSSLIEDPASGYVPSVVTKSSTSAKGTITGVQIDGFWIDDMDLRIVITEDTPTTNERSEK